MFSITRITSLILAFCLGFSVCAGVMVFGTMAFISKFRVRDLEKYGIDLPDEAFMGDNYEVDPLNLSLVDAYNEILALSNMGDELTINRLQTRYDLKIHHNIDALLSDEARTMPLSKLFSEEGVFQLLSSVYIGNIQKYECHAIDSSDICDPALGKEGARWYDPNSGEYITGIASTIAFFNLKAFASGDINVDSVLHGIVLADVLGYRSELTESGKKVWYDGNGDKVTGIMAVFADCTIDAVGTKINTVSIGDLIGYESDDNGVWYSTNEETGELEKVSGFMSKIANSSINSIGNVFETLQISDIVDEEERNKGIFSIIPADTEITDIDKIVNDSITSSPMQFYMNQGMITFENAQQGSLDSLCALQNKFVAYAADDEDFVKYYKGMSDWSTDEDGNYLVPAWRTQPLSGSFSYIVGLLTATPVVPDIPGSDDIPALGGGV